VGVTFISFFNISYLFLNYLSLFLNYVRFLTIAPYGMPSPAAWKSWRGWRSR
jgi:hypothetical protein